MFVPLTSLLGLVCLVSATFGNVHAGALTKEAFEVTSIESNQDSLKVFDNKSPSETVVAFDDSVEEEETIDLLEQEDKSVRTDGKFSIMAGPVPSKVPSAVPSRVPSAKPFVTPTAQPSIATRAPTALPTTASAAPTATPSATPTTAAPSATPTTAAPSATPTTAAPSATPTTAAPTITPSAAPTITPSAAPTATPSATPTATPSAAPTAIPTAVPTANPSAAPSANPTAAPTANPSAAPSATPSAAPTAIPTAVPTVDPSAAPTVAPSAAPSAIPSAAPTATPSIDPSAAPSVVPTAVPSATPTVDPTAVPSAAPTVDPTAAPTIIPTAAPTTVPTLVPTAAPTVRPTITAVKNVEISVAVSQTVFFMTVDNYNAQKAAYNRTIQYTVAASMDGVTPDRVTDIDVQASTATGSRQGGVRGHAASGAVALNYKVKVYDPLVSYDSLVAQITTAAATGQMDDSLHHYAVVFNANNLNNGTFSAPLVTNQALGRASSSQLTGAQIAGLVIGIILFLALLATLVLFVRRTQSAERQKDREAVRSQGQAREAGAV